MNPEPRIDGAKQRGKPRSPGVLALAAGALAFAANGANQDVSGSSSTQLEETRVKYGKWIETQQLISKERKDWQQGKEVLVGRLELVKQEIGTLHEKIAETRAHVEETHLKRDVLRDQSDDLQASTAGLGQAVTGLEARLKQLFAAVPEPVQTRLQPLYQRIPDDPEKTKASVAERFQNVLGILNELNKANNEISVNYEIHELAGGKPAEVKALYVGLAQAYYVSAGGEAGIGRPTADGWKWESSKAVANDVLTALEILQGKHTPAFVPLPAKLQ